MPLLDLLRSRSDKACATRRQVVLFGIDLEQVFGVCEGSRARHSHAEPFRLFSILIQLAACDLNFTCPILHLLFVCEEANDALLATLYILRRCGYAILEARRRSRSLSR